MSVNQKASICELNTKASPAIYGIATAFVLLLVAVCNAHPINVHQVMSLEAAKRATRMQEFLEAFSLKCTELATPGSLLREVTELMGQDEAARVSHLLSNSKGRPGDLIAVGSILEDAGTNPLSHFYTPTSPSTGTALTIGGILSAKSWLTQPGHGGMLGLSLLDEVTENFVLGFGETDSRKRALHLKQGFISLGQIIHLVQDMTQPSHTLDDGHMCLCDSYSPLPDAGSLGCSAFEVWGQNHSGEVSILANPVMNTMLTLDPRVAIIEEANFSAANFFSDESKKWQSIFGQKDLSVGADNYVYHASGELKGLQVALLPDGERTRLRLPPTGGFKITESNYSVLGFCTVSDEKVLSSNARALYPRAVTASAQVLNHFFRYRLAAEFVVADCNENRVAIRLSNVSKVEESGSKTSLLLSGLSSTSFLVCLLDPETQEVDVVSSFDIALNNSQLSVGDDLNLTIRRPASDFKGKRVVCVYDLRRSTTCGLDPEKRDWGFAACVVETPLSVIASVTTRDASEDMQLLKGASHCRVVQHPCSESMRESNTLSGGRVCIGSGGTSSRAHLSLSSTTEGQGQASAEIKLSSCQAVAPQAGSDWSSAQIVLPVPKAEFSCITSFLLGEEDQLVLSLNCDNVEGTIEIVDELGHKEELSLTTGTLVRKSYNDLPDFREMVNSTIVRVLDDVANSTVAGAAGMKALAAVALAKSTECADGLPSWLLVAPTQRQEEPFGFPDDQLWGKLKTVSDCMSDSYSPIGHMDPWVSSRRGGFIIVKGKAKGEPGSLEASLCWNASVENRNRQLTLGTGTPCVLSDSFPGNDDSSTPNIDPASEKKAGTTNPYQVPAGTYKTPSNPYVTPPK